MRNSDVHVAIPMDWDRHRIKNAIDSDIERVMIGTNRPFCRKVHRTICGRVGCDMRYAYSGQNPHYCPDCLNEMEKRGA